MHQRPKHQRHVLQKLHDFLHFRLLAALYIAQHDLCAFMSGLTVVDAIAALFRRPPTVTAAWVCPTTARASTRARWGSTLTSATRASRVTPCAVAPVLDLYVVVL